MTYNEYKQLLSQLPESVRKKYGFNEPFDYSPYKCIHTDEYDYYPELDCCVIQEIPIVWESDNPWVTPENTKILKGFQELITPKTQTIKAVYLENNKVACYSHPKNKIHINNMKRKGCTSYIKIENEKVYYNPNEIDLPNNPETIHLITCLFWAQTHESIGLIPDKTRPTSKWELTEFIGDTNNENRN